MVLQFENPEYISMEATDYMKVSFNHTDTILKPKVADKDALPDGYTMIMALPPQTGNALS